MKNPRYYLLRNGTEVIGWKRVVTEFLPLSGQQWRLKPIDYDEDKTVSLSAPPVGVVNLPREGLGKGG